MDAARISETAPILLSDVPEEGVVRLTLNRPEARNALSDAMLRALRDALDEIAEDPEVRVVVLAANGPAFCAGHDLKELRANPGPDFFEGLGQDCAVTMQRIQSLPQPVIAQVHAPAYAAGCQLVATVDLAIAGKAATFCTPGVHIGLFCSTPMVPLSRTIGRKKAMEMLLTGDAVDADTAAAIGLVNTAVPDDRLTATVMEMARRIASKSSYTVATGKEAFYRQIDLPIAEAYDYANAVMARNMLHPDAEEGIDAFIEKRRARWRGRGPSGR